MGAALYVERETVPSVIPGDEIMIVARDKGHEGAPPRLFVVALDSVTQFETRTGLGSYVDGFSSTTSSVMGTGQRVSVDLAAAVAADHSVYVVRCLSGRFALTIVSPHGVEMLFRSRGARNA